MNRIHKERIVRDKKIKVLKSVCKTKLIGKTKKQQTNMRRTRDKNILKVKKKYKLKIKSLQTGGKVYGSGSFGCIVDSVKHKLINEKTQVSKLIDSSKVSFEDVMIEYKIGKDLKKLDKHSDFFIYPKAFLEFEKDETNEELVKDLKKCRLRKAEKILNLVMDKAIPFEDITEKLNKEDFLKSLLYCLEAAKVLLRKNIAHFDIKSVNLLYKREGDKIHPVIIDFSPEFIIRNKSEYERFKDRYQGISYPPWPSEIFDKDTSKMSDKEYKEFIDKVMVFEIGTAYSGFNKTKNKQLRQLMSMMRHWKRPSIDTIIDLITGKMLKIDSYTREYLLIESPIELK